MDTLPILHAMTRVDRDIEDCIEFIRRQPLGKPLDRERDLRNCFRDIVKNPTARRIVVRRRRTGVELRRRDAGQFAVIYAYFPPTEVHPLGVVSIRAVRHRRVKSVFYGVQETAASYSDVIAR